MIQNYTILHYAGCIYQEKFQMGLRNHMLENSVKALLCISQTGEALDIRSLNITSRCNNEHHRHHHRHTGVDYQNIKKGASSPF